MSNTIPLTRQTFELDLSNPINSWIEVMKLFAYGYLYADEGANALKVLSQVIPQEDYPKLDLAIQEAFGDPTTKLGSMFKTKQFVFPISLLKSILDKTLIRVKQDGILPDNCWCYLKHKNGPVKDKSVFDVFTLEELGFIDYGDFMMNRTIQAYVVRDEADKLIGAVPNMITILPSMPEAMLVNKLNLKPTAIVPAVTYFGEFIVSTLSSEFKKEHELPENTEAFVCVGFKNSLDKAEIGTPCTQKLLHLPFLTLKQK